MLGAAALFAFALLLIACAGGIVLRQFQAVATDATAAEGINHALHDANATLQASNDRFRLDNRDLVERVTNLERVLKASQALLLERIPHATTGAAP